MYLAQRHPTSYTPETFPPRWRQHGRLAMSLPNWTERNRLYMHTDLVRPVPVAGASDQYDGVGYVIFKGDPFANVGNPAATGNANIMLQDELLAFAGPVMPMAVFVADEILKPGRYGGVTAFMWCNDEATARNLAEAFAAQPGAGRVVFNRIIEDRPASADPQVRYKAVAEVAAPGVEEIKTLFEAVPAWRKADLTLIDRDAVLFNEIDAPAAA
jgi:hypothetical protein